MQVINSALVSNPWQNSRTKNEFNRQKPSNKMDASDLHFYELANWIPQSQEKKSIVARIKTHASYKYSPSVKSMNK